MVNDELDFDPAVRLGNIEADLDAVDAALTRLDDDSYGRCARCGENLPPAQLDAQPLALTCLACGPG